MSLLKVDTIQGRSGTNISLTDGHTLEGTISEVDRWVLTSDLTSSANPITSNLSRPSTPLTGSKIGTGMTVSSGIWTFPTTGHWYVQMNANVQFSNYASGFIYIYVTANNGTDWTLTSLRQGQGQTNYDKANLVADAFLDITDTSNHKVYFKFYDEGNATLAGDSVESTNFTFIRLGDT